jgi:transcriptional regulator with XRE-family HTH domain
MSLLERGLRVPSILVLQQLAAGLGTTMSSLIQGLEAEIPREAAEGEG